MIHQFINNGIAIVMDVNSGSVHVADPAFYRAVQVTEPLVGELERPEPLSEAAKEAVRKELGGEFPAEEIEEVIETMQALIDGEELFTKDSYQTFVRDFKARKTVVKALCLHIAHDCNLACRYCFAEEGEYHGRRALMSFEVGKKALDFLVANSGARRNLEVDFFGGEPLMNLSTVKAVTEYVRQREQETGKEFKLTLTTNGMLLSDKNIAWLNDNHLSVVLSADGRREVHDAMRPDAGGHGTYDVVMRNFKKFVDARGGNDYYLRGTYTHENLDFTKDVLAMNAAGFDILSMEPVVLKDSPLGFTEEDLPRIYAEYDRLTQTYLDRVRAGKGFFFFHFNMDLNHGPCVAKRLAGCGAGHEYYAVAENGDLYPCHQFVGREGYRLGSVFTGVESMELPTYFRNSHVLNKPLCRDCWARFYCSGGCHANADLFHGDIRQPYEIGCAIQKKRLECAILVQAVLALEKEEAEEEQKKIS